MCKYCYIIMLTMFLINFVSCAPTTNHKHNAKRYLKKFGYTANVTSEAISDADFKTAVEEFQKTFSLPVTGEIDDDTTKIMGRPRCGSPDKEKMASRINLGELYKWPENHVTYKINNYPVNGINNHTVLKEISKAFHLWTEQIPVSIRRKRDGDADIKITFDSADKGDGPGGVLAYAFLPQNGGDVFFDAENWTSRSDNGFNFLAVAAHEFGHSLGLGHSRVPEALMYPIIRPYSPNLTLHADDINLIQLIYGRKLPSCNNFDAAMVTLEDILYLIKDKYCWKFINNNLAFGYPKLVTQVWPNIPTPIQDAFYFDDKIYFIHNTEIWTYNDNNNQVEKTDINIDFIIDAAFVINNYLYLFSDSQYWKYEICFDKLKLMKEYPKKINTSWKGAPSSIDGAYYDHDCQIYFFKDTNVYIFNTYDKEKYEIKPIKDWIQC